jgi:hypothetical protein
MLLTGVFITDVPGAIKTNVLAQKLDWFYNLAVFNDKFSYLLSVRTA